MEEHFRGVENYRLGRTNHCAKRPKSAPVTSVGLSTLICLCAGQKRGRPLGEVDEWTCGLRQYRRRRRADQEPYL